MLEQQEHLLPLSPSVLIMGNYGFDEVEHRQGGLPTNGHKHRVERLPRVKLDVFVRFLVMFCRHGVLSSG